uniref:Actin-related protein 4 n=1 Tax=Chenopodium quinoa TaxID=63459 RepID=A0A803MIA2_CHEQI
MYGGDEVSAIVIDMGSHTCKAGYAGEDAPKAVFPSSITFGTSLPFHHESLEPDFRLLDNIHSPSLGTGRTFPCHSFIYSYRATTAIGHRSSTMVVGAVDQMEVDVPDNPEKNLGSAPDSNSTVKTFESEKEKSKRKFYVLSPFKDGVIADWDIVDSILDHGFRECLLIDPKEHPMLLAEPSANNQQQRERAAELMFEKYKVPALFLAKNAVLTSFASGRATSLVVDSGGGSTTVAPVHDGYVLQKAVLTSPIGGEFLTDCLTKSLESKGIIIKPRYSFKRKEIRPGEFQRVIASDIKECVCRAPDTPYDETSYSNIPMTPYELPDGQTIEIGSDRFKTPDVLFNPSLVQTIPGMESYVETAASARGLPQMLAGGTASMQQLKERLEKDLLEESPQAARVKVLASGNATERRFSVWIGGSILASLGSFQQMWFSKAEYEEHGASYIQRKCP